MTTRRVLVITTSHAELGQSGHRTGVWLEELAVPYYTLIDGGADVLIASIKGGPIPYDPRSTPAASGEGEGGGEEPAGAQDVPPAVTRFLSDSRALQACVATPAVDQVANLDFDALFLPGGHGTMWDLPGNEDLARLVARYDEEGRIVAAVCHGPAGLVSATRADGRPIVEGRRVTAFTNSEEAGAGLTDVVPFLLEDRLRDLGARFEHGPDWQSFAVADGHLVTGQNPQSSEEVAQLILQTLAARATAA